MRTRPRPSSLPRSRDGQDNHGGYDASRQHRAFSTRHDPRALSDDPAAVGRGSSPWIAPGWLAAARASTISSSGTRPTSRRFWRPQITASRKGGFLRDLRRHAGRGLRRAEGRQPGALRDQHLLLGLANDDPARRDFSSRCSPVRCIRDIGAGRTRRQRAARAAHGRLGLSTRLPNLRRPAPLGHRYHGRMRAGRTSTGSSQPSGTRSTPAGRPGLPSLWSGSLRLPGCARGHRLRCTTASTRVRLAGRDRPQRARVVLRAGERRHHRRGQPSRDLRRCDSVHRLRSGGPLAALLPPDRRPQPGPLAVGPDPRHGRAGRRTTASGRQSPAPEVGAPASRPPGDMRRR